jgi:hypothetical protein
MQEHREADRDPEKQTTSGLCTVCMSCPRSVRFSPCGHCIACYACADELSRELGVCPLCRQRIFVIRHIPEDDLGDSDLTFSDPGFDAEPCYNCARKAIWIFTCPDCANQRILTTIDLQSGWENLRHSRFALCKKCLGKFRCPFCRHLAVETDVLAISDHDSVSSE